MGRLENTFQGANCFVPVVKAADDGTVFEIYVTPGFCNFEHAQIVHTLRVANSLLKQPLFSWRCVADASGFVKSVGDVIVEAEMALDDVISPHTMIVVGGVTGERPNWMRRVRTMRRKALPVVLLSDAATSYIKQSSTSGNVTTHWRDALQLTEEGNHPNLTNRFSEKSNGVITAAGGAATAELIIGLIAQYLTSPQVAELGNQLLLHTIRKSDAEQPKFIADNASLFDLQITQAIRVMEENIVEPLQVSELAEQVGVSTRHLERAFRTAFSDSPARFYKRIRTKQAKAMIEETLLPLVEVAVATGFASICAMSKTVRDEYGASPSKMRDRKKIRLLTFAE